MFQNLLNQLTGATSSDQPAGKSGDRFIIPMFQNLINQLTGGGASETQPAGRRVIPNNQPTCWYADNANDQAAGRNENRFIIPLFQNLLNQLTGATTTASEPAVRSDDSDRRVVRQPTCWRYTNGRIVCCYW